MWFFYALTFAITNSFAAVIAKRVMKTLNEYQFLFLSGLFTTPFLLTIILHFYQIPEIDNVFIMAVSGSIFLDVFAAIFAYRAIKMSDLSLVAPMSAFNPVFTTLIAWVFLGESIEINGILGIVLVSIGAYLLQITHLKEGWMKPLKKLLENKAIMLSLAAYLIWSVTPILQKIAIYHTNPQVPPFVSLVGLIVTTIFFGILAFSKSSIQIDKIIGISPFLVAMGLLTGIGQTVAFMAFSLTNLGFATSVFKLSMIFTVLLSWIFFKEKNIKERFIGSVVMLIGVILLVT